MEQYERDEQSYMQGANAVWRNLLQQCVMHLELGLGDEERDRLALLRERSEAIAMLRRVCAEFGDNDWPDDGYLPDIIEKHLGDHIRKGGAMEQYERDEQVIQKSPLHQVDAWYMPLQSFVFHYYPAGRVQALCGVFREPAWAENLFTPPREAQCDVCAHERAHQDATPAQPAPEETIER